MYLHYTKDVNRITKDGTKGEISSLLTRVFENLHNKCIQYFKPEEFWMSMRKHLTLFDNTNQHDS